MRAIAWIGVLVFLAAWVCPVMPGQDFFKARAEEEKSAKDGSGGGSFSVKLKDTQLPEGPSWLPGWEACRFAWQLLVEGLPDTKDPWKDRVRGGSCLTNVLMVLGLLLLLGQRSGNPLMGLLMLAAAGLNASWIYLDDDPSKVMENVKLGYWLWTGSFVLVGLGLMAGKPDDGYVVAQPRH
jgi:hypothetical protein